MGHDIRATRTESDGAELAYLRRGAFDKLNDTIYKALDCVEMGGDGGWSGWGKGRYFTREELFKGLANLSQSPDFDRERLFLAECIANCEDKIYIYFG